MTQRLWCNTDDRKALLHGSGSTGTCLGRSLLLLNGRQLGSFVTGSCHSVLLLLPFVCPCQPCQMPGVFVVAQRLSILKRATDTQSSHGSTILQLSTCDSSAAFDSAIVWAVYHEEALTGPSQWTALYIISRNWLQALRINNIV